MTPFDERPRAMLDVANDTKIELRPERGIDSARRRIGGCDKRFIGMENGFDDSSRTYARLAPERLGDDADMRPHFHPRCTAVKRIRRPRHERGHVADPASWGRRYLVGFSADLHKKHFVRICNYVDQISCQTGLLEKVIINGSRKFRTDSGTIYDNRMQMKAVHQ